MTARRIAPPAAVALVALLLAVTGRTAQSRAATPGPTIRYAAVGDSITDTGVTAPGGGWVKIYAADIDRALGTTTIVTDLGIVHATSGQILLGVQHDAATRSAIGAANLVTVQAGINDFLVARGQYIGKTCGGADNQDCLRLMVSAFDVNWDQLMTEIRLLAPAAALRSMDVYYAPAGVDEKSGDFDILNGYLSTMNAHILGDVNAHPADVHKIYNGTDGKGDPFVSGYLLSDDLHPSSLGHLIISIQINALGYAGLPHGTLAACSGRACVTPAVRAEASPAAATGGRASGRSSPSRLPYVLGGILVGIAVVGGLGWYAMRRRGQR